MILSDITNYIQTMLAARGHLHQSLLSSTADVIHLEAIHFVTDGTLKKGCFLKLKLFQANVFRGKKSVVL